jgi:hypothetical protein
MDKKQHKFSDNDHTAFKEIENVLSLLTTGWEPLWEEVRQGLPRDCSSYIDLVPYSVDRVMSQLEGAEEGVDVLIPPWCRGEVVIESDTGGSASKLETTLCDPSPQPLSEGLGQEVYVSISLLVKKEHHPRAKAEIGIVKASRVHERCSPLATVHPLPPVGCSGLEVRLDYKGGGVRAYIPYKITYSKERLLRHKFKKNSSRRRDTHQGVQIVHDGRKAHFFGSATCQTPVAGKESHTVQSVSRWMGDGSNRDTKVVIAEDVKGALISMPKEWNLSQDLLRWCRAERLPNKIVVTCYYTGHVRDLPLKGWEDGLAQHLSFLNELIANTHGLGVFHIYCLKGSEKLVQTLRLTDPIRRQTFVDHEGSRSSCLWGHAMMETNLYEGVIHFWTNAECTVPHGSVVYAKGKCHEEATIGDRITVQELDYLIPWEREKKYCHSPLGGVLQMAVRVFGMQCGALHADFRYEENISQWCQQSRVQCGMSFVISCSDVISINRLACVKGDFRGPEKLRKYEYSFFGNRNDRRSFFE